MSSAYDDTLKAVQAQAKYRHKEKRQRVSPAEVCLLEHLWLFGLKPHQQVPAGPYDLDFYFEGIKLCVEVDGRHHINQEPQDTKRDRYLRDRGIACLRIPARLVFWCPAESARLVSIVVESLLAGHPYPHGKVGPTLGILEELREERIREGELQPPWVT